MNKWLPPGRGGYRPRSSGITRARPPRGPGVRRSNPGNGMRLTVHLSDGATLTIGDFDAATALDLREGLDGGSDFLTFDMDGATIFVNRAHIVRADLDDDGTRA